MAWTRFIPTPVSDDDGFDHLTDRAFNARLLSYANRNLIGPHQNRELNLMIQGRKPLAMVEGLLFRFYCQKEVEER
jgi:hypothetical protein